MRKKFSVDYKPQIESGEYKVTCNGKPIQIVKWDCKGRCPILGIQESEDGCDSALLFKDAGCTLDEKLWLQVEVPNNYDEVEQAVESLISRIDADYAIFMPSYDEYVKEFAPIITEVVKKKLTKENGCGIEFPYFGANYPDAVCICGYLYDLNSGGPGEPLLGGDDPCPVCNTEKWLERVMNDGQFESEEAALAYVEKLKKRYL